MDSNDCLTDHKSVEYTLSTEQDELSFTELHMFTCGYCKQRAVILNQRDRRTQQQNV